MEVVYPLTKAYFSTSSSYRPEETSIFCLLEQLFFVSEIFFASGDYD